MLIINADDWGRDRVTTDRTLECIARGSVSSVSAMVFMADSQRAAARARERRIDAGLHLNFTTPFAATGIAPRLIAHQRPLTQWLRRYRLAPVVFHPWLIDSFEYVVRAQLDEFRRLYGAEPHRIDGHHHMHLCANLLWSNLLPPGTLVRRNFSFQAGEKGLVNRLYRRSVDALLRRRHQLMDFFFSLAPLEPPERLQRIFSLARQSAVEVEAHPAEPEEFRFLTSGEIFHRTRDLPIAAAFTLSQRRPVAL